MRPSYRKFVVIPGILVLAIAAAAGLSQLKGEAPKRDAEPLDLLVEVLPLETYTEQFVVRSQGTVRPRTQTVLSAEVSGAIVDISPKFIAGGVFGRDEVLLRIDPTDYRVAVDKAEALVKQRQIEYDGAVKLRDKGYRAEAELASAAAALASARAELVSARRNLERTYIRLPYEGMVLAKDADLGQFVNPGTRLGVTFATDVAEVRLPLTDQDLALLELPAAADITSSGAAAGPRVRLTATRRGRKADWPARIVRTEGVVDERSRVTYAVARIEDPYRLHGAGEPLPIGTFVAADISGRTLPGLIRIPRAALRGSDQVLIVDDDSRIRIRTVAIVHADQRYAYISGGVQPGERITTTAIEAPVNGMAVRTHAEAPGSLAGGRDAPAGDDGSAASKEGAS
ncbi:MAG: efflux RND transporter periplasmic adaptor subunit [Woeseiaceae bacterium]|nr:efflux RND transporter periplasmic adaptor subunit [Woeseiaceae bacterium]